MAPRWPLSGLLLLALLYGGGGEVMNVTQTPTLQVAFAREMVSVTCRVQAPKTFVAITVGIYKVDEAGKETQVIDIPYHKDNHSAPENSNLALSKHSFRFQPTKDPLSTGSNYYCIATAPARTSARFRGEGTFIHVRDTGYLRNQRRGLNVFLKTTCGVLTALSLVGTGLLLLWKKKGYPTWSSVKAHQADGSQEGAVSGCSTADPTYTSLEPNSVDTYDIIEREVEMQPAASVQLGPMPSTPKHKQLEKKKSPDVQDGGKKRTSDVMPSTPKHKQLEKKKSPDVQAGGKKRTSDVMPSTPKHKQLEKKKSPDVQAGGKKRTSDVNPQPAAKQEEVFDTVYENL